MSKQQVYHLLRGGDTGDSSSGRQIMEAERSGLPPNTRAKLHKLFCLIEKEFECLYLENVALQEKLDSLTEKADRDSIQCAAAGDDVDALSSARSCSSTVTSSSKVFY